METSTLCSKYTFVCTHLTETPTDQPRVLSNDQTSRLQFGISIKVGKAVITQILKVKKKSFKRNIRRKFHADRK